MDPRPRGLEQLSPFQLKDELIRYARDQTHGKSATHTFLNAGRAQPRGTSSQFSVRASAGEQKVTSLTSSLSVRMPVSSVVLASECAMSHDFNTAILTEVAHRPWAMPPRPWVMTQTWLNLLFAHWPMDPRALRSKVPSAFELDVIDGDAWIGVVPFYMTNVTARGLPSVPKVSEFPELNVRTYVRVGDRPGVYFFSLDAGSPSLFTLHGRCSTCRITMRRCASHRTATSSRTRASQGVRIDCRIQRDVLASGSRGAGRALPRILSDRALLPVQCRSQRPAVPAGDPPSAMGAAARGNGARV